ncbi:MAG: redox-active disulfide protein 2 [Fervidicoccus fontis]|uniref:Small redox-active disulfide protein 2 n=1 Tax=Thermodesulfobium acidiphilum TaxID=1794699 RepID=A0A2R4VY88_THEAF|nr:thioredoxin family protein [Thermodesulfobium acidiphilum]AWB09487.1 small redox-active disulfide protein 2 [Thermodesulfobium acidiphilum]PMB77803.1 MAG: redox-active disulfide protein 2 [Fervidicoccus fontis]HEM56280.1 thioredoxin family protein [Thermodesulfobium narugense]
MIIKILGTGCTNCNRLYDNTKKAIEMGQIPATIYKVEDVKEIMKYKVMTTPVLVVDEKVVFKGKVPSPEDILKTIFNEMLNKDKDS